MKEAPPNHTFESGCETLEDPHLIVPDYRRNRAIGS